MVRLGEVHPPELSDPLLLPSSSSSPPSSYPWEEYSLHQRDLREATAVMSAETMSSSTSFPSPSLTRDEDVTEITIYDYYLLICEIISLVIKNMNYNLLVGEPIVSIGVSFFLLMVLGSRISFAAISLLFAFLINLNPLYVTCGYLLYRFYLLRFRSPRYRAGKLDLNLGTFEIQKWNEKMQISDTYDHILIGNDFSTYLTAAFLSRIGRRCCLLEPVGLPPQHLKSDKIDIPLNSFTLFRPDRLQKIFHSLGLPQLLTPVGTKLDGYCHTILSFNMEGSQTQLPLRAGSKSLHDDLGAHPLCSAQSLQAFDKLQEWCQTTTSTIIFYVYSTVTSSVNWSTSLGRDGGKWLTLVTGTTCTDLMHQVVEDSYVNLTLRMLSYWVSEEYSMKFEKVASSNLMNSLVQSVDGAYTIPGGFPTMRSYLVKLITAMGGMVLTNVPITEISFNEKKGVIEGILIQSKSVICQRGLISGTGVLNTLTHLIPSNATSLAIVTARSKLKKVEEKRPKMSVIFWVAKDLEISSCEYVEYLVDDTNIGEVPKGPRCIKIWSPSARDCNWSSKNSPTQVIVVEIEIGNDLVQVKTHPTLGYTYFDSTKQPLSSHHTPSPLSLSATDLSSLINLATSSVLRLYPSIKHSHILRTDHIPPYLGGYNLSSTVDKFLSKITAKSDIPGLYFCGKDISFTGCNGEIMSALAAVSAVLGYSPAELKGGRNIITDLEQTAGKVPVQFPPLPS